MNFQKFSFLRVRASLWLAALALGVFCPGARAGLTLDLQLQRVEFNGEYYFGCTPYLSTNSTPPHVAFGTYRIESPNQPTSGFNQSYVFHAGGFHGAGGGGGLYQDFDPFMQDVTNGLWSIYVTNTVVTNVYKFRVTANITSNALPRVTITFPAPGSVGVTNQPNFTWQGPVGWAGHIYAQDSFRENNGDFSFVDSGVFPITATNWAISATLPDVTNRLFVQYLSNATAVIVASTPTNSAGQAISHWVSGATMMCYANSEFLVGAPSVSTSTLLAHYTFDTANDLGLDSSPNQFHLNASGSWNGGDVFDSADAIAGGGAVEFNSAGGDGGGYLSYSATPGELLAALAGDFSISIWVKTTQSLGDSGDFAFHGAGVVSADVAGLDYDLTPLALTEGEVAFNTGGNDEWTVNSGVTVNDGDYHHVVVTRRQATGEKKIYVDGQLDNTAGDDGEVLDSPVLLTVGALMNAGEPNPGLADPYNGYEGLLDDLQIYSSVLSGGQVGFLFANPGLVVTNSPAANGHTNIAHYRFDDAGLGTDDSGQDNNFFAGSSWGTPEHEYVAGGAPAGAGAVQFYGFSAMAHFSDSRQFTNITSALAGSFSVSLWVRTDEVIGFDGDNAKAGAIVVSGYDSGTNDVIPVAITGNKVAFHTGDESGNSETLHSTNDVTDGTFHHIVVTRDQASGEKRIYVDGVLEATETGTTRLLNDNDDQFSIGGTPGHGFDGVMDDLQIYAGVLSASEVATLYNNPGNRIPNVGGGGPSTLPVDMDFEIVIVRNQDVDHGDVYYCFPKLTWVNVTEITEHRLESRNDIFGGGLGHSHSYSMPTLASVIGECMAGDWKIYLNEGHATEQVFTFQVSISDLTTNVLKAALIQTPTNGSTGVSPHTPFQWSGPDGFNGVFALTHELPFGGNVATNQPGNATNWPGPPALNPGANRFYISISLSDFPGISCTAPVNGSAEPVRSWVVTRRLHSDATSDFVVSGGAPAAVQLVTPQRVGNNFQFQFLSATGTTNTVQSRTNLALGTWVNRTNVAGDGSVKTVILPVGNALNEFFRVLTQ